MAADFEVLEDGVPQKIDSFEHVLAVRGPQTARTQPSSQRDMLQALANPRNRIFLVFLDGPFVDDVHARAINEPLIKFLSTELADDDLVAIMTPNMSASQVTFGKKTEVLAETVRTAWWSWGRQNKQLDPELDKRQIQYELCYPGFNDVPGKMIARSRERATLEALQDAVNYLASVREERKAIIAVTEGWLLYREDPDLVRQRGKMEAPLGVDKMRVGPTGKLTLEDTKTSVNALSPEICDRERVYLANIDNDKFLREIIDDANRGNSTFYMIDPGGLKTSRADRSGAMRTLAENTDGLAVLNTNDLDKGLNRLADDMSSVLPPRLLRVEYQARRPLPHHHGAGEAARHRRSGEEGVPRADCRRAYRGSGRKPSRGRGANGRADSYRPARQDSPGGALSRRRCRRTRPSSLDVGRG